MGIFLLIAFQELVVVSSIMLMGLIVKISGSGFDRAFDETTEKLMFTFVFFGLIPVIGLFTGAIFLGICLLASLSELFECHKISINKIMKKIFKEM